MSCILADRCARLSQCVLRCPHADVEDTVTQILEAALADRNKKVLHSGIGPSAQSTFGVGHNRGPPYEPLVYTLAEFCAAHRVSRSAFYEMAGGGLGPKIFKIGSSIRISQQSAAEWRAEREAAHSAATKMKEEEEAVGAESRGLNAYSRRVLPSASAAAPSANPPKAKIQGPSPARECGGAELCSAVAEGESSMKVFGAGIKCSVCDAQPFPDDPTRTRESFDLLKVDGVWLCEQCREQEKLVDADEADS
jgi:hypothetical protein